MLAADTAASFAMATDSTSSPSAWLSSSSMPGSEPRDDDELLMEFGRFRKHWAISSAVIEGITPETPPSSPPPCCCSNVLASRTWAAVLLLEVASSPSCLMSGVKEAGLLVEREEDEVVGFNWDVRWFAS